jgi:hypothetical protein
LDLLIGLAIGFAFLLRCRCKLSPAFREPLAL